MSPACPIANAAHEVVRLLPRESVGRLLGRDLGSDEANRRALCACHGGALIGLLNRLRRAELEAVAAQVGVESPGRGNIGRLRLKLWHWGARAEAGGDRYLGTPLQPVPRILRGKLVHFGSQPAIAPPGQQLPRAVPEPVALSAFDSEPETIDELLDRAHALIGVRLGRQYRNKGAYGSAVASILGLAEDGAAEPDWRGEVEIKTVPVARDGDGVWFVKEDPAVSMEGVRPLSKLVRVLWIARVADEEGAPVLSWFYQESDEVIAELLKRDLHRRPKGGVGATTKGWYLHKRFFVDSGLLLSLNGR